MPGILLGSGGVKGSITDLRLGKKLLGLSSNTLFHFGVTRESCPQQARSPEVLTGIFPVLALLHTPRQCLTSG